MTDTKDTDLTSAEQRAPCCDYARPSCIYWNPYNRVVQCHNCGASFQPSAPTGEPDATEGPTPAAPTVEPPEPSHQSKGAEP